MNGTIDKYIDSKLRNSEVIPTSSGFTRSLIEKIQTEYSFELEIRKTDRAAIYIIGFFASMLVLIGFLAGYIYFSSNPAEVYRVSGFFEMNFFERITSFVRMLTSHFSSHAALTIILSAAFYFLADRLFLSHKHNKGL
jgi:hypothetical protein